MTPIDATFYFLTIVAKSEQDRQASRSFIETARRAQIVECAIDVIAEVGYANASMARIAERAGISRGLILYHFASKNELIGEVIATVYADGAAYMRPRIDAESTAAGKLRAYIASNLEYMQTHPEGIVAAVEILSGGTLAVEALGIDPIDAQEQALAPLVDLFRRGQADGDFRQFDPTIMARAVRDVIDGVAPHVARSNVDLDACARELTTLFDLATRNPR